MNRLLRAIPMVLLLAGCSALPGPSAAPAQTPREGSSSSEPTPDAVPHVNILDAGRVDREHGWALTATNLFLTDDAGATWRSSDLPGPRTTRGVLGVMFADADRGWLATLDSNDPNSPVFDIWRTTDGAASWTRTRVREGANRSDTMGSVDFDALPGDAVFAFVEGGMPDGYTGDLYPSTDGGASWGADRVTPDGGVTGPIAFADPDHAVVSGGAPGNRLFSTSDGGRTWRRATIPPFPGTLVDDAQLWAPARFWDARSGALAVTYGTPEGATALGVLETTDAGTTWSRAAALPLPLRSFNNVPMAFLDPTHWIAQMGPSMLVSTDDGGATWSTNASVGLPVTPDSLLMADRDRGWALVQQNGCLGFKSNCFSATSLFATNDGGATWMTVSPGAQP